MHLLDDGRIIPVDYTNHGDKPGNSHLVGVYLHPKDLRWRGAKPAAKTRDPAAGRALSSRRFGGMDAASIALGRGSQSWASGTAPITEKQEIRSRAHPSGISVTVSSDSSDFTPLVCGSPTEHFCSRQLTSDAHRL